MALNVNTKGVVKEPVAVENSVAAEYEVSAPLPEKDLSPEELERLIVEDIHLIYAMKNAV